MVYVKKINLKQWDYVPFFIGYTCYLFIGITNPLLISSTGFIMLITQYFLLFKKNIDIAMGV